MMLGVKLTLHLCRNLELSWEGTERWFCKTHTGSHTQGLGYTDAATWYTTDPTLLGYTVLPRGL